MPHRVERRGRRRGLRRAALAALAFCASLAFLGAIAGGLLLLRLSTGPMDINLAPQIAAALNARVGPRYVVAVGSTAVVESDHGPQLAIDRFTLREAAGRTILTAPRAHLAVDLLDLAFGRIVPRRIEVQDVTLRVSRREDGSVGIAAGSDGADAVGLDSLASTLDPATGNPSSAGPATPAATGAPPAPAAAPSGTAAPIPDRVAAAVSRFVDVMFDSEGPLHAIDRLGLRRGTLIVDDRLRRMATTYRDLTVDVDREATGGLYATVGADGPTGRWTLAARLDRHADGAKNVDLAADHLSSDEVMLVAGLRPAGFETDMPLSFSLSLEVGPDGRLRRAAGPVTLGAGYFKLDDPDHEPAMVDRIEAKLAMAPDTGALALTEGTVLAGPTSYAFTLSFTPVGADWKVAGDASGVFGAERPGETPIKLDRIGVGALLKPQEGRYELQQFTVNGPDVAFAMTAALQVTDPGFNITSDMTVGRMPAPALLRLWPSLVAAPPRAWLLANLRGGTLDYGRGHLFITDADIATMRRQRSVPDDHVHIEFGFSGVGLSFLAGVPPLKGLDATGVITGDRMTLDASRAELETAPGHKLAASEGSFTIPSMDPKPTPTEIKLRLSGSVEAAAELISRDALKPYADLPIDPNTVSGQVDGRLTINMLLGNHVPADATKIRVDATARDFAAAKVIGRESLTDATIAINADRAGLHAKGDGRMFGAPATIDLRKAVGSAPAEAQVSLVLDDAARQKAGFALGKSLTGPVAVKLATTMADSGRTRAQVEVDLTRAAFDASLPGLKKAAGRPSKATFVATLDGGRTSIDQLVFDNGSAAIRGAAVLDANNGLVSAALSQLRLSPGDEAKAEIVRTGDGLKVTVRGTNIDARPFFKSALSSDAGPSGDASARDFDLDLRSGLLTGENAQAISGADLKLTRRGGVLRKVAMTGRLGRGPFSVATTGAGPGTTAVVAARDAGAVLAFLDLYKRMDGGRLDATLRLLEGRIDGLTTIHQFTIKEDPTIKRLADEQIPSNSRNAGARIDPAAVSFSKLEATFSKVGNRVEVRQASMFGPNVGATVEGTIDFAHDRVALSGTFVPIYGLNNLFSQIPVVGLLLGGGTHEGLFALNYRITGSTAAPVLTFNPLSALAPGFLRKIFGVLDDAAQQGLAEDAQHEPPPSPGPAPPDGPD